jgi:hypothetical protein
MVLSVDVNHVRVHPIWKAVMELWYACNTNERACLLQGSGIDIDTKKRWDQLRFSERLLIITWLTEKNDHL